MRARLLTLLSCLCRARALPREFAQADARWVIVCSGRDPATRARFDARVVLRASGDAEIRLRGAEALALPDSAAHALWALLLHFPHGYADAVTRAARRRTRCRVEVHRRLPSHEVVHARCDLTGCDASTPAPSATTRLAALMLRLSR